MIWGVITTISDKNENVSFRLDTPLQYFGFFDIFGQSRLHISDDFVLSIFVAIYGVFETRRESAAVTLFLSGFWTSLATRVCVGDGQDGPYPEKQMIKT